MTSQEAPQEAPKGVRTPYTGSCHCGHIKYVVHLTLPPPLIDANPVERSSTIRLRKCNCSTCHKMSFFHVRLQNSAEDFALLSPLSLATSPSSIDPEVKLRDYTCFEERIHWYFCGTCGVRCFAFMGEGEVRDVEIKGEKVKAWAPKRDGWAETGTGYLSVNAATLDQDQEGLDLREWHEKGWIAYLDCKWGPGETRLKEPHGGGMY